MTHVLQHLPEGLRLVVATALVLGLVIFVHELGHFIAAKMRRVRVLAFSVGFGPRLFGIVRGGTDYKVSAIPLGGYVQMAGDSPLEDGTMPAGPEQFLSHPWPGRIWIAFAGPFANLITAFIALIVVASVTGITFSDSPNVLGALPDTSAAYAAGLREGDRIVALDGTPTPSWVAIFQINDRARKDRPRVLHVERAGARLAVTLSPAQRERVLSSIHPEPTPPVVGMVAVGAPAYKAGLLKGDRVLAVDGQAIRQWSDLPVALRGKVDSLVTFTLLRGQTTFDVQIKPLSNDPSDAQGIIGIEAPRKQEYVQRFGLGESVQFAFWGTGQVISTVYQGMWMTLMRPLYYREYLGGPMFIAQAASQQAERGLDALLQFFATINIAIMAFNLLPMPVLDGGHILLAIVEALRRRGLTAAAYLRFQKVGLVVLGALFLFILANDPLRVLQRQRALDRGPHATPRERTVVPSAP